MGPKGHFPFKMTQKFPFKSAKNRLSSAGRNDLQMVGIDQIVDFSREKWPQESHFAPQYLSQNGSAKTGSKNGIRHPPKSQK
jgi:hypothetical protein